MNNGQIIQKAPSCRHWKLATDTSRLPTFAGVCGAFAARREAAAGHPRHAEAQRRRQWRHQPHSEGNGHPRMVGAGKSRCGRPRTAGEQSPRDDTTGEPAGLQLVCADAVPARLRHFKAGRTTRMLFDQRLQSIGRVTWRRSNGLQAGALAACQKNANGSPATVRSAKPK